MAMRRFEIESLRYLSGLGNILSSEAIKGALPIYQNSPQKTPYNLYTEVLSGTAFTAPRAINRFSWLYRLQPSVTHISRNFELIPNIDDYIENAQEASKTNSSTHRDFSSYANAFQDFYNGLYQDKITLWSQPPFLSEKYLPPLPLRWNACKDFPSEQAIDFIQSLVTIAGNGSPQGGVGSCTLLYNCNISMDPAFNVYRYIQNKEMSASEFSENMQYNSGNSQKKNRFMCNNDAEMLIVPQQGALLIRTELGDLSVEPLEIALIPKGIKFQVCVLPKKFSALAPDSVESIEMGTTKETDEFYTSYRGYICENFGAFLCLPEPGPIGVGSGLANPRHFYSPVASFENKVEKADLFIKFAGNLWKGQIFRSPLDVVAWYGNLLPTKYDLRRFTCINSVTHDHPDPSIYTVLTSPTTSLGTANLDFVIFPSRWITQENTFRPPWFHRNCMSELMGLIKGEYDAKSGGFVPGGISIHNSMVGHGPDETAWKKATEADCSIPLRYQGTLAFMFESCYIWYPSKLALLSNQWDGTKWLQPDYVDCWDTLKSKFDVKNVASTKMILPFRN